MPWHNYFPRTAEEISRIIATDLPELAGCRAVAFGEGWDFTAWLVDETWLFRFPKRRQCLHQLRREIRLMERLHPSLARLPLRTPRYAFFVDRSANFPTGYAGYAFLPGRPLVDLSPRTVDPQAVGRELGRFFAGLRSASIPKRPRNPRDDLATAVVDFRRQLGEATPALAPELGAASQRLLANPPPPPLHPPAIVHGDLGAEHILVDSSGSACAIIDWGDAGWGDPLADFVGLWAWGGDAAAGAAFAAASVVPATHDWTRLRYWGVCSAIGTAYYGYKAGQAALLEAAIEWLGRMHRRGQIEDPRQSE